MRSTDNGIALRAVNELRANKWLTDTSLHLADLNSANLQNANLRYAKLRGVYLWWSNMNSARLYRADLDGADIHSADLTSSDLRESSLKGSKLTGVNMQRAQMHGANLQDSYLRYSKLQNAILTNTNLQGVRGLEDAQLVVVSSLRGVTMPDGKRYDGRYCLQMDYVAAVLENGLDEVKNDPNVMAHFYGVSLEEYLAGQEWARKHLAGVRREAGLDPDTGLPMEPANGTEPQSADAPATPAPRRNDRKASMVSHRVRR
jgi:hypothetical protein